MPVNRSTRQAQREKVLHHLIKGTPEAQIAGLLGVNRATVARDVAQIRSDARDWLDDLAKDGFIHEYHMALEKIRDHEFELQQLLTKAEHAHLNDSLKGDRIADVEFTYSLTENGEEIKLLLSSIQSQIDNSNILQQKPLISVISP